MKTPVCLIICLLFSAAPAWAQNAVAPAETVYVTKQDEIIAVGQDILNRMDRVKAIVNQPVTHVPRGPQTPVASVGSMWFKPVNGEPDYNTVDVTQTQQFPYDKFPFVTSDMNPTEMFVGNELEFNEMTKYFYTDLTWPKRKLMDSEMQEINQLYRIIGADRARLEELKHPSFFYLLTSGEWTNYAAYTIPALMILAALMLGMYLYWFASPQFKDRVFRIMDK